GGWPGRIPPIPTRRSRSRTCPPPRVKALLSASQSCLVATYGLHHRSNGSDIGLDVRFAGNTTKTAVSEAVPVQPDDESAPRLPSRHLRDACRFALRPSPYVVEATNEWGSQF